MITLRRRLRRLVRPTALERRVASFELGPDDLAIDCGANVGDVTFELARTGAFVHAFEPNPDAFAVLSRRFEGRANVQVHEQAVLDRTGSVRLYLHVDAERDAVGASVGSSVLSFKGNVDSERFVEVSSVDLAAFILALERPTSVLKIDVEGAECPVVHRLLDTGAIDRVGLTLIELHDRHIPELRAENDRLRDRLESEGLSGRVLTDWH
ncbi:MAG TPA: FkbM family methyltransferase [Gaiellaceae bacterium]|nr:FkbM family methyltransferase [Gaiellaceae bacterium]